MKFWILVLAIFVAACWYEATNHLYLASAGFIAIILLLAWRGRDQKWDLKFELHFYERELRRTNREIGHLRSMKRDWADDIALIGAKKEQVRVAEVIAGLRWDIFGQVDGLDYTLEMEL